MRHANVSRCAPHYINQNQLAFNLSPNWNVISRWLKSNEWTAGHRVWHKFVLFLVIASKLRSTHDSNSQISPHHKLPNSKACAHPTHIHLHFFQFVSHFIIILCHNAYIQFEYSFLHLNQIPEKKQKISHTRSPFISLQCYFVLVFLGIDLFS